MSRSLWSFASWLLPLVVVFIAIPPLLAALGPARFGVTMIVLLTPNLAVLLDWGLTASGVRRVAVLSAAGPIAVFPELASLAMAFVAAGAIASLAVWAVAVHAVHWLEFDQALEAADAVSLLQACAVWLGVCLASAVPSVVARGQQRFALMTLVQTVATAALWLGALGIATEHRPLAAIAWLGCGLAVLAALATVWPLRKTLGWDSRPIFSWQSVAAHGHFAGGMLGTQLATVLTFHADRFAVSALAGPTVAGAYALAVGLANRGNAAIAALTAALYPRFSAQLANGDRASVLAAVNRWERVTLLLLAPTLLPIWFLSPAAFALWLGGQAPEAIAQSFRWLWLGFACAAISLPAAQAAYADGRSRLTMAFAIITATVALGAIAWLVPTWHAEGAAWAMTAALSTAILFRARARAAVRDAVGAAPAAAKNEAPVLTRRSLAGLALGFVVQLLVLVPMGGASNRWLALVLVLLATLIAFFSARAIIRALFVEEHELMQRLFGAGALRSGDSDRGPAVARSSIDSHSCSADGRVGVVRPEVGEVSDVGAGNVGSEPGSLTPAPLPSGEGSPEGVGKQRAKGAPK